MFSFPTLKKKADMCIYVAHAANQDSSKITDQLNSLENNLFGTTHTKTEAQTVESKNKLSAFNITDSHVQRSVATLVFKHLQNRLANHPLNQYLCSLSDILPKNQFSHHLIMKPAQ